MSGFWKIILIDFFRKLLDKILGGDKNGMERTTNNEERTKDQERTKRKEGGD